MTLQNIAGILRSNFSSRQPDTRYSKMLKTLRIKNFKAWEDTGPISMAPITLFFGANSSGKSSIGQFLMMLKQTAASSDQRTVFYPGRDDAAVQLGSFREMVYGRNLRKEIEFEYRWSSPNTLSFKDPISDPERVCSGDELDFQAIIASYKKIPFVSRLKYELFEADESVLSIGMERPRKRKANYVVAPDSYKLKRSQGRAWPLGAPIQFYGFPDEVVAYHQNADFVKDLNFQHEKLFQSISYLGPIRIKAKRLYSWTGVEPENVGNSGENAIAAFLAARKRRINLGTKKPYKSFNEVIASKLKEMGLIEEFEVQAISAQRQEFEVRIRTRLSEDWVDLPDVGFGISQVLPVLVQCFYAPRDSIIVMEQPELHLHPRAQSALADVMIDVINSREDRVDRNIQLIIETHSEHFLRRLQRRIAEGAEGEKRVVPEQVSAYFARADGERPVLEPLDIDDYGYIKNWPDHFFGDEMGDIMEQTKSALKRCREQKGITSSGDE